MMDKSVGSGEAEGCAAKFPKQCSDSNAVAKGLYMHCEQGSAPRGASVLALANPMRGAPLFVVVAKARLNDEKRDRGRRRFVELSLASGSLSFITIL
jgi:hypothetical protein